MVIHEGFGNHLYSDLVIRNYPNLEKITVKNKSLQYAYSLLICNNKRLKCIEIDDCETVEDSSFYRVNNVVIKGILICALLFISSKSRNYILWS